MQQQRTAGFQPGDLTPLGACECGCGRAVAGRFLKGHGGHSGGPPPIVVTDTGCWLWTGKIDKAGYGRVRRDKRDWLAHRWVYDRLVGLATTDVLDHLCRVRACVNPEHLDPVTDAVNVRRGLGTKLSAEAVTLIRDARWAFNGSERGFAEYVAPIYGVSPHTIRSALRETTWGTPRRREFT